MSQRKQSGNIYKWIMKILLFKKTWYIANAVLREHSWPSHAYVRKGEG